MSKTKRLSTWFLALSFLVSAGFYPTSSEAARKRTASKAPKAPVRTSLFPSKKTAKTTVTKRKRKVVIRRNQKTPSGVFALYQNPLFGYGKCLPELIEPAHKILSRNDIDTKNANPKEKEALAKGIAQVERLLGEPIPPDYRYDYQWVNASGAWNSGISRAGYVTVKRPPGSLKGLLTGRMMHELGHRFGHANGGKNYQEYRAHMRGKKCAITTYCHKSLNEEFAETFEAYIVNPDFLAKHCPDSYAYFKNKLFRNSEALLASCEDPNSILDHDHEEDGDDAIEDTNEQQIDEKEDFDLDLPDVGPIPAENPRATPVAPEAEPIPVASPTPVPVASPTPVPVAPETTTPQSYIPIPTPRPQGVR